MVGLGRLAVRELAAARKSLVSALACSSNEPIALLQTQDEGNFIEATEDTPFLQIGEHKYGKPILDRVAQADMRLGEAAKLLLLSFTSTLRSNLFVGMPLDMVIYERDSLDIRRQKRFEEDDAYFRNLSADWSQALREEFADCS